LRQWTGEQCGENSETDQGNEDQARGCRQCHAGEGRHTQPAGRVVAGMVAMDPHTQSDPARREREEQEEPLGTGLSHTANTD
jgi:hypothetical protein